MSGYDVKQFLERTVVHFWSESYGQIYPALRKLEEDGVVDGRTEPGERGQEKRVYRITDAGREELRAWLREPAEPTRPRYEHSLKLFFGHNVGPEASLEHGERVRRRTEANLAQYRAREEELSERAERESESQAPYWLVVLRGGVLYSEMVLEWCDESESRLRALQEPGADDDPAEAPRPHEEDDC
jgi:DNA-binding PadR family transcriptional regulator